MAKVKDLLVNGSSRFIGKIYASDQFISQVANGTAPFVVSSSTLVANLNADMTDGLHVHTGRNNEVNKIVRTDANGYIQTGYINTNVGTENLAISRIFYEYNNDGYIRKMSPSSFFSVLENSGNDISITVAGQNRKLTVGYASNSDKLDGYHASDLTKFYLSPMEGGAPASSAKSWFENTMPSGAGAIVYNVPGSEKTIIVGKSTGPYGHMLQLNYDDKYLRILRYYVGNWRSDDWEKISAGYADSAGDADKLDGYHANDFATAGHTHYIGDKPASDLSSTYPQGISVGGIYDNGYPFHYGSTITAYGSGGYFQIAGQWNSAVTGDSNYDFPTEMYIRGRRDSYDVWTTWTRVLTDRNYTNVLDNRYYTETEADNRFVNVTGDTMSGALTCNDTIKSTHYGPGFANDVDAGKWAYTRFKSGSNEWHIGTNSSGTTYIGAGGAFEIRSIGASYSGISVRYNTSSYGKLVVSVPSGECSIGYYSNGAVRWTVGCSDGSNYGWYQGSNGGWKMTLNTSGYLTASGFIKSGSSDSYVLLGGGGHKALSDFSMAHSHPYLSFSSIYPTNTINLNDYFSSSTMYKVYYDYSGSSKIQNGPYESDAGAVINFPTYSGTQVYFNYNGNDVKVRTHYNGHITNWATFITSENIRSQSVNYADSAGSVAWANITGKPSSFTPSSHSHPYLPTTQVSQEQASNDDWIKAHALSTLRGHVYNTHNLEWQYLFGISSGKTYGSILRTSYGNGTPRIQVMGLTNGTWSSWREVAYDDNTVKKDGTGASGTWGISISGNAATATNANTLDGYHASYANSKPWGTIPVITDGGYMDVGKHFEFHYDNTTGSDYSTVLACTGNYSNIVRLPSKSGTLALLTDNVASASKWATPRIITLTGSVTGSVSIDGSQNVSLATTTNHTHNYAGSSSAGGSANSALTLLYSNKFDTNYGDYAVFQQDFGRSYFPHSGWFNSIKMLHNNSYVYFTEIAMSFTSEDGMWRRALRGGTQVGWYKMLDSGNYNSYALPISGGTLTGSVIMRGIDTNLIRDIVFDGTSGWARGLITLRVDGVDKFNIGAYGGYTVGASSNGIYYGYIGCNSYDGLNLRISATSLSWGDNSILHAGNYNSYCPKLDGTGASGTWNISISGNAATATNADKLDGYHKTDILRSTVAPTSVISLNDVVTEGIDFTSWDYAHSVNVNNQPGGNSASSAACVVSFGTDYPFQIYSDYNDTSYLYYRSFYINTGWKAWRQFAFLDSNVASSSKWATPRTITLTGSVTGSVSIDGSANVSLATTTNHTHNYAGSSSAGGSANSALTLLYNNILDTNYGNYAVFQQFAGLSDFPHSGWFNSIKMLHNNSYGYFTEIAMSFTGEDGMWRRALRGGAQAGWYKILDSGNYNSYCPKLDGTGATGTWGINISGNAATATNAENISSIYPQLAASSEADEINVKRKIDWNYWGDGGYQLEAAIDFNWYETHNLFGVLRGGNTDSAGFGWMYSPDGSTYTQIARLSPYGQLYLASSLTISGAISGVTDITASGHTKVNSLKTQYICIECDNSGNTAGRGGEINNYDGPLYLQYNTSNNCVICGGGGNVGIGTASHSYKLHVVGDIYTTTGFKKEGSSDSYVLLGGGGHKALSDFDIPASTTSSGITSLATGSYSSIHISTRFGGTMSFSSTPAYGKECHIIIYNSGSSTITITLPSGYRRNIDSITIASGAFGEVNVLNAAGTIYVRAV